MVLQKADPSKFFRPLAALLLNLFLISACNGNSIKPLPDGAKAAAKNAAAQSSKTAAKSPNVLAELGIPEEEIKIRLAKDYQQFFHGDEKDQRVFYSAGKNANGASAYILDVNSDDVRSEGMSYDMMIAVQLDKKVDFDALWNWALTYMYHGDHKHPAYGYFSWSMTMAGVANDEMPAPDGEEYFATALYFAASRWGDGDGIYEYSAWADRILTSMLHRQITSGAANNKTMSAGNMFNLEHAMVRFTPDLVHAEHTDVSYHLPAFYEIWARVGPASDRDFWRRAATASRDYFVLTAHPETALTPDYGNFDGTPWAAPWRPESVDFRYDAWRSAMNWSMDWAWWGKDPRQPILSDKLQAFFETQGLDKYQSLYTLDGKPLGGGQTTGLVAMNATASLAATHPRRIKYIRALWDTKVPTGQYRYYDGMLYMLAMLNCSGQYRDWTAEVTNKEKH